MLYMQRRTALVEAIHRRMGGELEVIGAEAGMHLVVLLPPGTNDLAVSRHAAQKGISAMPLSSCYLKPPVRSGLILGYGSTGLAARSTYGIRKLRTSILVKPLTLSCHPERSEAKPNEVEGPLYRARNA